MNPLDLKFEPISLTLEDKELFSLIDQAERDLIDGFRIPAEMIWGNPYSAAMLYSIRHDHFVEKQREMLAQFMRPYCDWKPRGTNRTPKVKRKMWEDWER